MVSYLIKQEPDSISTCYGRNRFDSTERYVLFCRLSTPCQTKVYLFRNPSSNQVAILLKSVNGTKTLRLSQANLHEWSSWNQTWGAVLSLLPSSSDSAGILRTSLLRAIRDLQLMGNPAPHSSRLIARSDRG